MTDRWPPPENPSQCPDPALAWVLQLALPGLPRPETRCDDPGLGSADAYLVAPVARRRGGRCAK